jgi:hypothetical protein
MSQNYVEDLEVEVTKNKYTGIKVETQTAQVEKY